MVSTTGSPAISAAPHGACGFIRIVFRCFLVRLRAGGPSRSGCRPGAGRYDRTRMQSRLLQGRGLATFALLVACAEVAGRSLTGHVDRAFHVQPLAPSDARYYPFLLVGVKVAAALACAALFARAARAFAAARAGERLLAAVSHEPARRVPRLRPGLSPRVWCASFLATSVIYLAYADAEGIAAGRWPLFSPWLHTYALPVFAVASVAVAALWRVAGWLHEVEVYAARTIARVRRILTAALHAPVQPRLCAGGDAAPRRRFGLVLDSRPPPLRARPAA